MNENVHFRLKIPTILFSILFGWLAIYCFIVVLKVYYGIMNNEISDTIIVALFSLFFWYKCIKNIIIVFNINKHPIVKKYGKIEVLEKIIKEINKTIIYEDKKIIISKNYISAKSSYKKIFHLDDVINAYQFIQKTNGVESFRDLVIVNKTGEETHIAYRFYEDDLIKALNVLGTHRNDIRIGYIR